MGHSASPVESFDEIDGKILEVLAEDPRTPYSEITARLAEDGYEMSTEGVRYRVKTILETTTVFFLLDPQEVTWEILRLVVSTTDEPGAKQEAFEFLCELPFWHVSRGVGTYDLYAVGSTVSISGVDELTTAIREHEAVEALEYLVVTDRNRDMSSYLNLDYIATTDE